MQTIQHSIEIEAAPATVHRALTTTEGNRAWWTRDCEVGSRAGDTAVFRFDDGKVEMRFRIDKLDPTDVRMTCVGHVSNPDWHGTILTYRLTPAAGGKATRLDLEHSGFREKNALYERCVGGWAHFMGSIKSYLENGQGKPYGAAAR
jgi:uncharacterized protein YndB with AHSA1/START domain